MKKTLGILTLVLALGLLIACADSAKDELGFPPDETSGAPFDNGENGNGGEPETPGGGDDEDDPGGGDDEDDPDGDDDDDV